MKELRIKAITDNLGSVLSFVDEELEEAGCSFKIQNKIDLAVEEIFVNIANYAYPDSAGDAVIRIGVSEDQGIVTIEFSDQGIPYDPLAKEDPDVDAPVEEREIGGLGIYMVKKMMDSMSYEYKDGQNVLTLTKTLQ